MEIRLLLEKYKNLGFPQKKIKEITISICKKFSLELESEDIDLNKTELKIKISGAPRAHFALIKRKLEKDLQDEFQKEGLKISKIY